MDACAEKIDSIPPDFVQQLSNELPNVQSNFKSYILRLMFTKSQDPLSCRKIESRGLKGQSQERSPITVQELIPYFIDECKQRFLPVDTKFATYFIHLLVRDTNDGLNLAAANECKLSVCKLEKFIQRCLEKYANPLDPTLCSLKLCFFQNYNQKLDLAKENSEVHSMDNKSHLVKSILQYPETSNQKQLEEMFSKMQIFIITKYKLGDPRSPALIKEARQSLNSVLGKGDLQKYVLKKRYNRIAYLQRLGATVAGIIIFNNWKPQDDKVDNLVMRDIFSDIEMAQSNTKEALEQGIRRATLGIMKGDTCLKNKLTIKIAQHKLQSFSPLAKLRIINNFIISFHLYKRYLNYIRSGFEKVQNFIETAQIKLHCVVDKITANIKCRSAIESELIFPHFVFLSEVWSLFILYLNQLVEINKIIDRLNETMSDKLESHFDTVSAAEISHNFSRENPFEELLPIINKKKMNLNIGKNSYLGEFCALTLVLTNGLLVASNVKRIISANSDIQFGFANAEFANYCERNVKQFEDMVAQVIFSNVDLTLLFALDRTIIKQDFDLLRPTEAKSITTQTQTDFMPKTKQPKVSWNMWDYHRTTIHLANLRQKQTHSSQSTLSFGRRNTQLQAYNTREHLQTQRDANV